MHSAKFAVRASFAIQQVGLRFFDLLQSWYFKRECRQLMSGILVMMMGNESLIWAPLLPEPPIFTNLTNVLSKSQYDCKITLPKSKPFTIF